MYFSVATVAALITFVAAQATDPTINTPTGATQCSVTQLTFQGSSPPFTIDALPGQQISSPPLTAIVTTSNSPYSWTVNINANTPVTLRIRDSKGQLNYSGQFVIQSSSDSSCFAQGTNGTTVSGSATGAAPSSASASASSASASGSSAASTSSNAAVSGSSSASTSRNGASSTASGASSGASPSSTGGASNVKVQWGVAGVAGLVGAALLG